MNLQQTQKGFTMIEVLVALIVLAIGLLGVAGVQTLALKSTTNAHIRSQVNLMAADMAERMRANVPGIRAGGYTNVTAAGADPGCGNSCTPSQLAVLDSIGWFGELNANLPGFTGASVTYVNGMATITINWTERDLANDAVAQTYQLNVRVLQ